MRAYALQDEGLDTVEAERGVGIDSVEALVLQRIGAHLVGEPETAAFLLEIEDDAAALFVEALGGETQLVAAVAPARSEHVPRETCRMQPHRYWLGEVRVADDHPDRTAADRITEDNKA